MRWSSKGPKGLKKSTTNAAAKRAYERYRETVTIARAKDIGTNYEYGSPKCLSTVFGFSVTSSSTRYGFLGRS